MLCTGRLLAEAPPLLGALGEPALGDTTYGS